MTKQLEHTRRDESFGKEYCPTFGLQLVSFILGVCTCTLIFVLDVYTLQNGVPPSIPRALAKSLGNIVFLDLNQGRGA